MNTPAEIAKNYVGIGKGKVNTPPLKLFILGIMAGIFIGIGGIAYEMATATIGGALGKLVGACMFGGTGSCTDCGKRAFHRQLSVGYSASGGRSEILRRSEKLGFRIPW